VRRCLGDPTPAQWDRPGVQVQAPGKIGWRPVVKEQDAATRVSEKRCKVCFHRLRTCRRIGSGQQCAMLSSGTTRLRGSHNSKTRLAVPKLYLFGAIT